jgi:hypothetical protein
MNPLHTLETLIEDPAVLAGPARPVGLGRTGMLGYFAGTLGLFTFLRLQAAVPPGALSFLTVLLLVLAANFLFAGIMHLFLDLTGADRPGGSGRLFLAFGCTDFLLTLLVPLGFFDGAKLFNGFLGFCLCLLVLIYARVRLVRRLYAVSANKALLAVWLPYGLLSALFFTGLLYGLVWLGWLLV